MTKKRVSIQPPSDSRTLEQAPPPRALWRRLFAVLRATIRWAMLIALALTCVGTFYVAVILGESPDVRSGGVPASTAPPVVAPLPGGTAFESDQIEALEPLLPVRLAILPADQGFVLIAGKVEDLRLPGTDTLCRTATLTYRHPAVAAEVTLYSAATSAYMQRFAGLSFTLEPKTVMMGMMPAAGFETRDARYCVAVDGSAVYVLEAPVTLPELADVCGWITRTGAAEEQPDATAGG